jgi:nucleoside-diphosphate-sugar epimerase
MNGKRILVTGPTGQVGLPIALALAGDNDVWALARFRPETGGARTSSGSNTDGASAESQLRSAGIHCVPIDLAAPDFSELPDDFDYVANFAVSKSNDWERDLACNVQTLGALMSHCRRASGFLHCSSTAVYRPAGHHRLVEDDPLGDSHAVLGMQTYSISKIAAEAMVRFCCRQWQIPTVIARLNVPYGDNGGWPMLHLESILRQRPIPVSVNGPTIYNPIHQDDLIDQVPKLLAIASVPATIVNWGGRDEVSIEEWCQYLGEFAGVRPVIVPNPDALDSVPVDLTRLHELVGATTVPWKEGMRRMVSASHPELAG